MSEIIKAKEFPNTFQGLIDSHEIKLYSKEERLSRAIAISERYLEDEIVPAIAYAAKEHAKQRILWLKKRVSISRAGDQADAHVVEALLDPHFRKQRNFGPTREMLERKVALATANRAAIELIGLMFTRKNICPLKRSVGCECQADLAEVIALAQLNSYAWLLAQLHPYGARFTALSEGRRFMTAFETPLSCVGRYQEKLRAWIGKMSLEHIALHDYEEFLEHGLSVEKKEARAKGYRAAREQYDRQIQSVLDTSDMYSSIASAIKNDPLDDPYNVRRSFVPLWDSIRHSIPYPELEREASTAGIPYEHFYREISRDIKTQRSDVRMEKFRTHMIMRSWQAAIEHNARFKGDMDANIDVVEFVGPPAFRTTIRPKPNSEHLGIHFVRETSHRVHPWHGMAYIRLDGEGRMLPTTLTRIEIESMGGIPVCIGEVSEKAFFYVDSEVAQKLAGENSILFNLNTRV